MVLLFNCTKKLDSWLFCPKKKKPVSLISCMHYASLSSLLFPPFKKCK